MHICGLFTLGAKCNRRKNGNNIFSDRESNPGRLRDRPTLYHVAIKAGLYRKAVQVYHIPILPLQIEIRAPRWAPLSYSLVVRADKENEDSFISRF